jgi:hypothetical protein
MGPAIGMMSLGLGWTAPGFVIGLITAVVLAFWVAVIFVPVYNYLQEREAGPERPTTPTLSR